MPTRDLLPRLIDELSKSELAAAERFLNYLRTTAGMVSRIYGCVRGLVGQPALRFPYSSSVVSSRHAHMRELRWQHAGRPYRIPYAFDPRRTAILLIGGDKTGDDRWYETYNPWRTGCTTSIWPSSGRKVNEPMANNVKDLQEKMCPESRARSEAKAERLIQEVALDELRAARALTQEHLSKILGVQQSAISKLERRADMYVSTLRHFIEAMGGRLEIRAVFPDGDVRITQFQTLAAPKAERDSRPS